MKLGRMMKRLILLLAATSLAAGVSYGEPATGTLGLPERLATLVRKLNSCDPAEGAEAARELGGLGSEAKPAVPYLIRRHESHDRTYRAAVIDALGAIGDKRAVEVLIHSLTAHKELRVETSMALTRITGQNEREALDWLNWWQANKTDPAIHSYPPPATAKYDPSCAGGGCHEDLMGAPSARHEPMRDGLCTRCHSPSAGFNPQKHDMFSLDFADLGQVCLGCHKGLRESLVDAREVHSPVGHGLCDACHAPHGGQGKAFLKIPCGTLTMDVNPWLKRGMAIECVYCHKVDHFDPTKPEATGFRAGAQNLHALHLNESAAEIECVDCHDPHASGQAHMIRSAKRWQNPKSGPVAYKLTTSGGTCETGCHGQRSYGK